MTYLFRLCSALAVLALISAGCGDDSLPPMDTGTTSDTGPGADGGEDSAILDSSVVDTAMPPPSDHASYVPVGLTPEAAVRLIILGDSISAGSGASSPALVYHALLAENDDGVYPEESETDLGSLIGAAVEIVDVARGGARTNDLASQTAAVADALSLPAAGHTVVVVTIGGNDLQSAIGGGDPTGPLLASAMSRIETMIGFFQDVVGFPDGASIYIANVYDPSDGEGQIATCFFGLSLPQLVEALDVWRGEYVALGTDMGFSVIDMLGAFHGHGHHFDNTMNPYYDTADPTLWFDDCVHPNDRGHHELRRLFYEAMDPTYVAD